MAESEAFIWDKVSRQKWGTPEKPQGLARDELSAASCLVGIGCLQRIASAVEILTDPEEAEARRQRSERLGDAGAMVRKVALLKEPVALAVRKKLLEVLKPGYAGRNAQGTFRAKVTRRMLLNVETEADRDRVLAEIAKIDLDWCARTADEILTTAPKAFPAIHGMIDAQRQAKREPTDREPVGAPAHTPVRSGDDTG
ncbi:MAG TPA: hypothetical protein VFG22_02065 [Polyangiales bacterium]|nr:hypothetical protein [Polyangiales bacterium]